jgi:hypothetical protein
VIDKEVRALLPAWTACAIAIVASQWQIEPFRYLGVPAYFVGTAGLGAWVIGHEYAHGTLSSLLSIPVPRRRIWTAKLVVVAPLLAALAALGAFFVPVEFSDQKFGVALFVLPPLVAAFVAPWLTMLTRSPIAGAVFTFGAIGGSLALGDWIGTLRYGFTSQVDAFQVAFMWWSLAGLSAVAAVMGWRTFAGLQAIEGPGADVELPSVFRRTVGSAMTRRHPLLTLAAKELRLQQLPIAIAALWAIAYAVMEAIGPKRVFSPIRSDMAVSMQSVLTAFYSLVLPLVVGSVACAEERHVGTLDSQLLLPISATTQWVVKAATALVLALTLVLALPAALAEAFHESFLIGTGVRVTFNTVVLIAGLTTAGLYVSTITRSGMRALLGSIAALASFGLLLMVEAGFNVGPRIYRALHFEGGGHAQHLMMNDAYQVVPECAFILLLLALAATHYRSAALNWRLLAAHAAVIVACVFVYDIALWTIAAGLF